GLRIDSILLLDLVDLHFAAGQADDRRAEQVGILADFLRTVVGRIDRHENNVQLTLVARLLAQLDEPAERNRANVAAARVAEVDVVRFALEACAGEGLAVRSHQAERAAETRLRRYDLGFGQRVRLAPRVEQDSRCARHRQRDQHPQQYSDLLEIAARRLGVLGHARAFAKVLAQSKGGASHEGGAAHFSLNWFLELQVDRRGHSPRSADLNERRSAPDARAGADRLAEAAAKPADVEFVEQVVDVELQVGLLQRRRERLEI